MAKITLQDLAKELEVPATRLVQVLTELGVSEDEAQAGFDKETAHTVKEMAMDLGDELHTLLMPPQVTVRDLARAMECSPMDIQKRLMKHNLLVGVNQKLDREIVESVVAEFGLKVRWEEPQQERPKPKKIQRSAAAQTRPPVVTILGHVDHGKTSLLDYIRSTQVAEREFGGITQHIGAYQVEVDGKLITFLDTPGHEAFTAMRARGAQVTDIAVLVVAADDGIMPQTIEAINHAKNAKVPIIVALNKIDKPEANPQRVKTQLVEHELMPEEFGGDIIVAEVSAKTGEGIDRLLEMILLVAEIAELQADPNGTVEGTVIESKLEKGRGPIATILVQQGTLRVSDSVVVGSTYGRIRAMHDHQGQRVERAGPSTPVEIVGLNDVPLAGDRVEVTKDSATARRIAEDRTSTLREERFGQQKRRRIRLEDLYQQMQEGETKDLNVILKADMGGSVEAIRDSLVKMEKPEGTEMKIVHAGVGNINESDIQLAVAAEAIVLGFNVKIEPHAQQIAKAEGIDTRTYKIIYELLDNVQKALKGMLEPEYKEIYLGSAEIRTVFKLSRGIIVAGCYVLEGKIIRNRAARLLRNGEVVYEGKIDSIKHIKEDVREIAAGYECGITLEDFDGYKAGDKIECFEMQEIEI
jgi:translation initiation factor IF-2